MRRMLALALLAALAPAASAANMGAVRVPTLPAKFTGADFSASWRVWEAPMAGAFTEARGLRLSLTPEMESFAPLEGAPRKKGEVANFTLRAPALRLMTAQLAEEGLQPAAFAALPAAERVSRMQKAYEVLQAELRTVGDALVQAAEQAEQAGDRAALHEAQSRLTLLAAAHSDYIHREQKPLLRAARDKAFAAFTKLTESVVGGAAKSGEEAMRGGGAAVGAKRTGFSAVDDLAQSAMPVDANTRARRQLLEPLQGGQIPADFLANFARYQQMGDAQLSLDAVKAFAKAADNFAATGENGARGLQGLALIAREAPMQRARELAVEKLVSVQFLDPAMETLRVSILRELTPTAGKEDAALILKGLEAAADPKGKGPAAEALAAARADWKRRFGVPTPSQANKLRVDGEKAINKGLLNMVTGLIPVGMAFMGWFPTAMPSWLPWLAFLNPIMPFAPYIGLVMGLMTMVFGFRKLARARRR